MSPWLIGALLVVSLVAPAFADEPFRRTSDWKPLFRGVEQIELSSDQPRMMRAYAVRIALNTPGLRFLATPDNGDKPGHTDGQKTSTFLKRFGCQLAINASPFEPIHPVEGRPQQIEGLTISDGKIVSPARGRDPVLVVSPSNQVRIGRWPIEGIEAHQAVCGFEIVLDNGEVRGSPRDVHPRTGAGVSRDGQLLYFLVIDGRQKGYSEGATTSELGLWLKALGAWDGINLDGGGTSTLVIQHGDSARVVNRPIHGGIPGQERVSASHLGVFAPPVKPGE